MPYADPVRAREHANVAARRRRDAAFDAEVAGHRAALQSRPKVPRLDCAWAAGMFEGEGTATISTSTNRCGNVSGRCVITLTSTDPEIIDFFVRRWPPSKIGHRQARPQHKPALVWTLEGARLLPFIMDVRPFLRTSAERAKFDILEEAQWLRRRGAREDWRRDRLAELTGQIRLLNRRGREPSSAA